jgi:L-asparaginase
MKHKKILIIYTGGTIGMCASQNGYQTKKDWLSDTLSSLYELQDERMPSWDIIEYDPLLDSANASPQLWQAIADDIAKHYDDYNGFLVLHGTDTMAYSASAVSFLLDNLAKPVIFTGSQVPLSEIRSDARLNVVNSLYMMAHYELPEVCIYFDNKLLRGNRSVKTSASRYSAFDSPNYPVLAKVGVNVDLRTKHLQSKPEQPFSSHHLKQVHIASIRLFPGIDVRVLENILAKPTQALIIESYGAGNAPTNRQDLSDLLHQAAQNNILVVNCTQCLHGFVKMQTYATGCMLAAKGVIGAADMTTEATLAKLYYLLSQDLELAQLRKLMLTDLRGELST